MTEAVAQQVASPAAFFADPPTSPSALVAARRDYLAEPPDADKFQAAVIDARSANNAALAASGSWVTGEYRHVLELVQGDDEVARFIQGSSLLELDRTQEARDLLQGSEKAEDPELAFLSLEIHAVRRDFEGLAAALPEARLRHADRAYFEAVLLEGEGDYLQAIVAYQKLLESEPDHVQARFRLAFRVDLLGDEDQAIRHYEYLLSIRPVGVSTLLNLGVLYEDRHQFEKACGCFGAVLRRDPRNPRARLYFKDAHESIDMYYDEDLERKEDKLHQILRTPISDFELSVRARNCLANMDIRTLGDLVSHTEAELLDFKNFGETSLNEIKRVLVQKGLRLGLRREDGSFIVPEEFDGAMNSDTPELEWLGELSDDQREALDLQISSLSLSVRCHRALVERLNLQRVVDVLRYTEEDLLAMPNFGITSLSELQGKLDELDLRLRKAREVKQA